MSNSQGSDLVALLDRETRQPAPLAVEELAKETLARHKGAVEAVLFYGSCLRDGAKLEDNVVDLFVLVSDYRHAYTGWLPQAANAVLPPNVYFLQTRHHGKTVRAKYAVLTTADFCRGVTAKRLEPYFWARFAQPCSLVFCQNEDVRSRVLQALASAAHTLVSETWDLMANEFSARELWTRAFHETYRAELRAENSNRAQQIYEAASERYDRLTAMLIPKSAETGLFQRPATTELKRWVTQRRWNARRPIGKLLTVLRLLKSAFTFQGGAQYIAWKIERHSGVHVRLRPWQERHPILGGLTLFLDLRRKGAFR